jgi:hypothetical protein
MTKMAKTTNTKWSLSRQWLMGVGSDHDACEGPVQGCHRASYGHQVSLTKKKVREAKVIFFSKTPSTLLSNRRVDLRIWDGYSRGLMYVPLGQFGYQQ